MLPLEIEESAGGWVFPIASSDMLLRNTMPPSQERMDADRLLARQLSGSSVMPLGEDIWLHIMKMVRTVKVLWTAWIRRVYYDIWDWNGNWSIRPQPRFYGPGMEIGAYTGRGRSWILRFLTS